VQLHGALGYGEAKAHASTVPIPVRSNAVERVEDACESFFRHAGAKVTDSNYRLIGRVIHGDLHRGSGRAVADGIADDVLHGAPQQFCVAPKSNRLFLLEPHMTAARFGFDYTVVHYLCYEGIESDRVKPPLRRIAFGSRYLQQLAYQGVQSVGLLLNPVEVRFGILP